MQVIGAEDYAVLGEPFKGKTMEDARCRHPFIERESVVILGEHVTLEQGTGCVHTAPGHGQEDYEMGLRYGLDIFTPVDALGRFTEDFAKLAGTKVFAANPLIIQIMRENGSLVYSEEISHSYPHCWRCKKPVIFRATQQWFITLDHQELRKKSLEEIGKVQWIPAWGKERIYGMVENRPDWCISRQRSWGVPIVAFNCSQCKEVLLSPGIISHVADLIEGDGVDIWFTRQASDLLPEGTQCSKCGESQFEKETDILDVWFDSGVSHAAVIESQTSLGWPADLYLEGSDQHRGWFHSSLLTSVATRNRAPYKAVLTHGFTVDGQGKKMSKSLGNVIKPQKLIERYGAEIIRLWVAAEDYRDDVRISEEILKRLVEAYRRIRNTCRFILGNLYDFDPADAVAYDALPEIDRWALHRLQTLIGQVRKAYDRFEFHLIFHGFYNFCNVDMSAFYLDVLKDRLYVSAPKSPGRRAAQTVLYQILHSVTRLMAPILSFTAEEVWNHLTDSSSVYVEDLPTPDPALTNKELGQSWERILKIRGEVTKVLEELRREKTIGSSLDASVTLFVSEDLFSFLSPYIHDLSDIFIVSASDLRSLAESPTPAREAEEIPGLKILVQPATEEKCERCWMKKESVGKNQQYLTLCTRCVEVMREGNIGNKIP
jgi:isoleucyl-tRNA synthetase